MTEMERSVLTRQWLDRRIPGMDIVRQEIQAWYQQRNDAQKGVDW